jgi:hypothetical protein
MQGIGVPIADAINPVTPEDDRPSVKELIAKHRKQVDKIKGELEDDPLFEYPAKHDDLWIVRFWLSHKSVKPAVKAAKHTLQFRKEHKLDEMNLLSEPSPHLVQDGMVYEYWKDRCPNNSFVMALPDEKRGVVSFYNCARFVPGVTEIISKEAWEYAYIYCSEWCHQRLDHVTRTTGRLTKSVRLLNMDGIGLKNVNRKDAKRDGDVAGLMEDCYPQMLQSIYLCHAPMVIHTIWSLLRPVMPNRVVSKIDIIEPRTNAKERKCLLKYISEENLPVEFGGKKHSWDW